MIVHALELGLLNHVHGEHRGHAEGVLQQVARVQGLRRLPAAVCLWHVAGGVLDPQAGVQAGPGARRARRGGEGRRPAVLQARVLGHASGFLLLLPQKLVEDVLVAGEDLHGAEAAAAGLHEDRLDEAVLQIEAHEGVLDVHIAQQERIGGYGGGEALHARQEARWGEEDGRGGLQLAARYARPHESGEAAGAPAHQGALDPQLLVEGRVLGMGRPVQGVPWQRPERAECGVLRNLLRVIKAQSADFNLHGLSLPNELKLVGSTIA